MKCLKEQRVGLKQLEVILDLIKVPPKLTVTPFRERGKEKYLTLHVKHIDSRPSVILYFVSMRIAIATENNYPKLCSHISSRYVPLVANSLSDLRVLKSGGFAGYRDRVSIWSQQITISPTHCRSSELTIARINVHRVEAESSSALWLEDDFDILLKEYFNYNCKWDSFAFTASFPSLGDKYSLPLCSPAVVYIHSVSSTCARV